MTATLEPPRHTLRSAWSTRSRIPRSLLLVRSLTIAPVLLAFPAGILAVFVLGADRKLVAAGIAWCYALGLTSAMSTPFWPLPGLRSWSFARRVQSAVLFFVTMSYITHLTWELAWLLLHDRIAQARDQAWAYLWWAYIDGGDLRYLTAPTGLLAIETLSVVNGAIGMVALVRWWRSEGSDRTSYLLFMATAVVHLYSTSYYFLTEVYGGFANVDTGSFTNLWIKFGLANAPWLVMPWFVLWWASSRLSSVARS